MAAKVIENGKKFIRLSYSELSIGMVGAALFWFLTVTLKVQAQVIDFENRMESKADGIAVRVMDARLQEALRELQIIRKDLDNLVCRFNPTDLRCSR